MYFTGLSITCCDEGDKNNKKNDKFNQKKFDMRRVGGMKKQGKSGPGMHSSRASGVF